MKTLGSFLLAALLLAACSSGPGASPSTGPGTSPSPTPTRMASPITSLDEAAAAALAADPRLAGIRKLDPQVIGASAWWEGERLQMGDWIVRVTIGWGDCPAGCISRHVWTFRVTEAGVVTLESEAGPAIPSPLPG